MQVDFAALLEAMPDAVIVADLRSRIVYANRSVERLLGWKGADLVGRSLHVIQPERLHGAHDTGFGRYAATGTRTLFDTPIRLPARRADGEEVDIELNLAEIHDRSGERLVIGVLRDLSERVELERHLTVMRYLRATTAAAAQLWTALEPGLVLQTLTDVLVDDFDAALARTWVHEDPGTLRLATSGGLSTRVVGSSREVIDVATHPYKVGVVARTRRPFVRNGLAGDPDFDQEWVARERLEAVACLPLTTGGRLLGVMVAFFRHSIADEMVETLGHLSALAAAALNDADLIEQERLARAQADRARAEFELLARVSERIPGSLSPENTAQTVASVVVPDLADWCIFDLLDDGDLRMVAATHQDAGRVQAIHRLRDRYPPDAEASPPHPIICALRDGATVREAVTDADLRGRAVDTEHLELLRRVGIGAHVVCPLVARGRVLGTLSLVRDPARPPFDDGETATAEDVARRAALAIDNALLYQSAQQAVSLRDRFLAVASHELRTPLAIVRGNWELLSRRLGRLDRTALDAAGDVTPLLRRLGQGIDQLQRLVEDLLDVNRLRGEAIGFRMTSVDLVELL
ncbi:MAG: GAF domain-containing protein, partial [Chloroflexi bacterium]|nr:GAF domain-containing protein [Chloroflexota bacterium]